VRASCATLSSQIATSRHFTTHKQEYPFPTTSMDPPKHEMAYFPDMTTSLPSESADFRKVLWTGLYSQLVLMNVPVDGEIGDEVRIDCAQGQTVAIQRVFPSILLCPVLLGGS